MLPTPGTLWTFWLPVTVSEIGRWESFRNIRASARRIFVNFDIDLHLRSSVTRIRWPDAVRSFWWKLDENRLSGVDVQRFSFFLFAVDRFFIWKWRLSCCGGLHPCRTLFIELEHLKISNYSNSLRETDYTFFPLHQEKVEKQAKVCGENINFFVSAHRIENPLEFCDYLFPCARSVDITRYLQLKFRDLENVSEGSNVQHWQWRHSMTNTWLSIWLQ